MASVTSAPLHTIARPGLAAPWFALCAAVAVHVCDEALTGFLSVYNPTVLEARRLWPWFPMPTFTFRTWLIGLVVAVTAATLLTTVANSNRRWFRIVAWIVAALMFMNGLGHISGTILGHTFADIRFPRPMPGFYSSPLLLAASIWLMVRLRHSRIG